MAISIKNPRAEQLAREVAQLSGESLTQSIIHALESRLERLKGSRSVETVLDNIIAISDRCASLPDKGHQDPDEVLGYNEYGGIS